MIKEIISQWDKNKDELREYFKRTKQDEYSSYEKIVEAVFTHVIKKMPSDSYGEVVFDLSKMTVIDHGSYGGTQIFIIPRDTYQPEMKNYLIFDNHYGSCSGCDTLLSVSEYDEGFPNDEQVEEYMIISLHIIQRMKWLTED